MRWLCECDRTNAATSAECWSCGRPRPTTTDDVIDSLRTRLQAADAEIATLRTRAEQAEADLRAYQKRCADFEDALNRAEAERDEARALKVPPSVDELNAALMRAAVARVERDVATARAEQAEAERDRYRSALRDVAREWPYLDLIDPQTAQECDLRGLVEYLLGALRSEQRVAREALEGHTDA